MGTVLLIASGKGGVGKSTLTSALAIALGRSSASVCIVDADIGLRSQDTLLGVSENVVYDLMDVARKGCNVRQALVRLPGEEDIRLMAASQFARAKDLDAKDFARIVRELKAAFGFVLIDCPAGLERSLRVLTGCEPDGAIAVCTPDEVSIRDARRLCQVLRERKVSTPKLIVNRLNPLLIQSGEMQPAADIASELHLELLGEVPEDMHVYRALLTNRRFMDMECEAAAAVTRIAARLRGNPVRLPAYGSHRLGWLERRRMKKMTEG